MYSRRAVDCLWHLFRSFLCDKESDAAEQGDGVPQGCKDVPSCVSRPQYVLFSAGPGWCTQNTVECQVMPSHAKSCQVMQSHAKSLLNKFAAGFSLLLLIVVVTCSLLLVRFGPSLRISWHRQRCLRSAQQRCKV